MTSTDPLPALDDCIGLYARILDRYEDEPFNAADLTRGESEGDELGAKPEEVGPSAGADGDGPRGASEIVEERVVTPDRSLRDLLDLLVAYGLLDRHGDGRYRVRCTPEESVDQWRAKTGPRVETLHQHVRAALDEDAPDSDPGILVHEGVAYGSVDLRDESAFDSVASAVESATVDHPDAEGIVLRSPGELAAEVQRAADHLCGSAGEPEVDRAFEKETTDLVGQHKDDLEFRLFMRKTG